MGTEDTVEVVEEQEGEESESKPLIISEDGEQQEVADKGKNLSLHAHNWQFVPSPSSGRG